MQPDMTYHNMTCHQKTAEKRKATSWKLMPRKSVLRAEQEKCMLLRMVSLSPLIPVPLEEKKKGG